MGSKQSISESGLSIPDYFIKYKGVLSPKFSGVVFIALDIVYSVENGIKVNRWLQFGKHLSRDAL
jgi:hypothetical protein